MDWIIYIHNMHVKDISIHRKLFDSMGVCLVIRFTHTHLGVPHEICNPRPKAPKDLSEWRPKRVLFVHLSNETTPGWLGYIRDLY